MFRPRVIPLLLLMDKGLVKTINFKEPRYIGDPMNAVKLFNDFEADELAFVDIAASSEGRMIPLDFVKKVGEEAFMPFAVGGGIKTIEDIKAILGAGAEKVILNTLAIEKPEIVEEAVKIFGGQSIVISIDAKKVDGVYRVFCLDGKKETAFSPEELAEKMEELGVGEIIINSIDNDGLMNGYDLGLIKKVSKSVKIPVVAAGGAGTWKDLSEPIGSGASASAAGSIFIYNNKNRGILISYPDKEELESIFSNSFKN